MKKAIYRVSLDIHDTVSQSTLHCKKGDTARMIVFTLRENGSPYTIADGCTAVFSAKKPEGNIIYNECTVKKNLVIYEFTAQTASASGEAKCELKLYGADNDLITSPRFTLIIDDTVYEDGDVIESSSEYSALIKLVAAVEATKKEIDASAESAAAAAKNAESAAAAAKNAELAVTAAEQAASRADDAAATAEQAASDARTVAQSALNAAESANSAAAELRTAAENGELDGADGKDGYTPVKGIDYYTEEEKAEIVSELSRIEAPEIVSTTDEMTDTSKHYVNLNTGTIWAYMKYTKTIEGSTVPNFTNVFDADSAMIGYRWSGSSAAPVSAAHCILSDFIACDLSSGEHTIRIKNGRLNQSGSNAGIAYFSSNDSSTGIATAVSLAMTPTEEDDGVLAYKLGEANGSMLANYTNTRYIRCIAVQVSDGGYLITPQTAENAQDIIITIDEPITYTKTPETTETYYEWTDTDISYTPTFKTDLIGVLGEDNAVYLSDNLPSGTYTLKYGDETYDAIGTITVE